MIAELKSNKLGIAGVISLVFMGWQLWIQNTVAQASITTAEYENTRYLEADSLAYAREVYVNHLIGQLTECTGHHQ